MKRAFIFPGQGSQTVGMCKDIFDNFSTAKEVFAEVDEALNQKLSQIIFEGPAEELTLTANTQPALMACSIAILRVIEQESGKNLAQLCDYVAGHSLGEFSALTAARTFSLTDCARLLRIRGKAMQNSVAAGQGGMVALLGLEFDVAADLAKQASSFGICQIANDNSVGQQVVSGSIEAIDELLKLAADKGYKAVKLNVSAPFHCGLMQPAQEELALALAEIKMESPSVPLLANVTASLITDPTQIQELLVQQVTGMVRWRESVLEFKNIGVEELVEVGPGKVLTGLTKRIDSTIMGKSMQNLNDIKDFLQ